MLIIGLTAATIGCAADVPDAAPRDQHPMLFEDVSERLPPSGVSGDQGALWADFDDDGRLEPVFMEHGNPPLILRQQGTGSFEDRSAASGLRRDEWEYPQQRDRHGAACADLDKDGLLDIVITHGALRGETLGVKYDEVLLGNGNLTFDDVSRQAGSLNTNGRGRGAVFADVDNDGWLDIFFANFGSDGALYRNNGNGSFTDVTEASGLDVEAFRAAWSDYDQDGDVDLLLASPLRLMRNDGRGSFEDVTGDVFRRSNRYAYGIAWSDLDNDGDLDIVMSAMDAEVRAFMNVGGRFVHDVSLPFASGGRLRTTAIAPADLDNDGDIDLLSNTSRGIRLHRNVGDGQYRLSTPHISSRDPARFLQGDIAVADFDNDGRLDFATDDPEGNRLFRNAGAADGHWLRIVFEGNESDTFGFGNKVWITAGDELVAYREYHGADAGLRSVGCSPLQIGLGRHERVNVRVRWPNGVENVLSDVAADEVLRVVQ